MVKSLEKLQAAAALVTFDSTLRGAANTVAYFGVIFAVFGLIFTVRSGFAWGWGALAIGAALLGESFYIRRTRSPRALWVSGISFAVFAVWALGSFVLALARHDSSIRGDGVIGGVLLALGAWNILRSYSAYKALLETADPVVDEYVRNALAQMRTTTPSEHGQVIEFKKRGLGEKGTWRLQPDGDLLLICQFGEKTFGLGGRPRQAAYISRHDVQIEREVDRWLGKVVNAKLSIRGTENEIQIKPEMLVRLESLLTGARAVTTAT